MREDEMKDRVKRTLESRSGAFGALIAGDGLFTENHQMTYYLTAGNADTAPDPKGLEEAMTADYRFLPFRYVPDHPYQEPDEDAYEGPAELEDAFTELAEKFGYTLWV